jgi:alkyl hydroperoxide reductase subunit AhpC
VSVRDFDLKEELRGCYFLLLFLPMDFTVDAQQLRTFTHKLGEFKFNETKVVAVSAESAYVTR